MKSFLFSFGFILLFTGCYSSKIISTDQVKLTVDYKDVPSSKKSLTIPISAFIIKSATGYLIDEISDEFDQYAKAHIQHYKISISVEELYSNESLKQIHLIFVNKDTKEKFKLPFNFEMSNISSNIIFIKDQSKKSTTFFYKDKKERFKGIGTVSLKWKTIWRENNKSFEKVLFNDKVITFTLTKEGNLDYIYPETSDDKKSAMLFPPYSIINDKNEKSRHFLTFTTTLINMEESKIIKRLAEAYKDEKGNIKTAIVDAYKQLEEKDKK